jgi:hypothetical protein
MKVAVVLASFCCASAFGLHGSKVSHVKGLTGLTQGKPMVQPIQLQQRGSRGSAASNIVSP